MGDDPSRAKGWAVLSALGRLFQAERRGWLNKVTPCAGVAGQTFGSDPVDGRMPRGRPVKLGLPRFDYLCRQRREYRLTNWRSARQHVGRSYYDRCSC